MKKFLLFLFLIVGTTGFPQNADTSIKKIGKHKLIPEATTVEKLEKMKDSVAAIVPVIDKNEIRENISHNFDGILQLQKEQKARQKKAAMVRIGIGIGFLVLLVIGLRRKKK